MIHSSSGMSLQVLLFLMGWVLSSSLPLTIQGNKIHSLAQIIIKPSRPHVVLWILYMIIYTFLLFLIPCTWISFIWDQIIDPEFDLEHIEQPENRMIKAFYQASGAINKSFLYRNLIFVFIGVMIMLSSVLDLIITPCMLENPRVRYYIWSD